MKKIVYLFGAFLLVHATACGGGAKAACEDALEAIDQCLGDAGVGTVGASSISSCDDVKKNDKDLFNCMAEAYGNADCSNPAEFISVATEASKCDS